jgi:hypothetical protein
MPWQPKDAQRHKHGLSSKQAQTWAKVANKVLAETGDEGRAIRTANAAVGRHLDKRG